MNPATPDHNRLFGVKRGGVYKKRRGGVNKDGKVAVYILSILVIISFCAAAAGIIISQQEKQRRISVENELADALSAKDKLIQEKTRIEDELADAERKIDETESELLIKRKQIDDLMVEIQSKDKQIEGLTDGLEKIAAEKDEIAQNLAKMRDELTKSEGLLAKTIDEKKALEAKIDELNKSSAPVQAVDLPQVTVSQADVAQAAQQENAGLIEQPQPPTEPSKRVLKINKEFDFIIIDAGQKDGVEIGRDIEIYRDNQLVGKGRIEKVYESLSAAAILPEFNKDDIKEGDSVKIL